MKVTQTQKQKSGGQREKTAKNCTASGGKTANFSLKKKVPDGKEI